MIKFVMTKARIKRPSYTHMDIYIYIYIYLVGLTAKGLANSYIFFTTFLGEYFEICNTQAFVFMCIFAIFSFQAYFPKRTKCVSKVCTAFVVQFSYLVQEFFVSPK